MKSLAFIIATLIVRVLTLCQHASGQQGGMQHMQMQGRHGGPYQGHGNYVGGGYRPYPAMGNSYQGVQANQGGYGPYNSMPYQGGGTYGSYNAMGGHPIGRPYAYRGNPYAGNNMAVNQMQGNQMQGNQMQGNQMQGNEMQGRQMQGNQMQGNQMQVNQMQGNEMQGNQMQENQMQGNQMQVNQMQGNQMAGTPYVNNNVATSVGAENVANNLPNIEPPSHGVAVDNIANGVRTGADAIVASIKQSVAADVAEALSKQGSTDQAGVAGVGAEVAAIEAALPGGMGGALKTSISTDIAGAIQGASRV